MDKLTPKQEQFCEEFLIDLNATKAAERAGYSAKTAPEQGCRLLINVNVAEYLSELKAKRAEKVEVSQEEILKMLKEFAYSDITDTMDLTFSEIKELPIELRRMITSYKKTVIQLGKGLEKITFEIKFIDKMKAVDMINRHIGFYEEDNTRVLKIGMDIDEQYKS